jgi:predicted RNase H-like nuclease (RuvC/YqgF family)
MPRQRWRTEVLQELRNHGDELRNHSDELRNHGNVLAEAVARQDSTIRWLGEQNRSAIRDLKASVDRNTEVTDRAKDVLDGLVAEVRHSSGKTDELMQDIRAQTSALLILVDEIRGQR